jgi:hypothetical protein
VLEIAFYLLHYPFADRVYPARSTPSPACAPRAGRHPVGWRRRVSAAEGRALRLVGRGRGTRAHLHHKEQMLDDVELRYPARRYVMVDDKVRNPRRDERRSGAIGLTTVFVRQGHYAHDPAQPRRLSGG